MHVWLIRDAEPLPSDGPNQRLMRAGLLAGALASRGHRVTWFNSTFDHYRKAQRGLEPGRHAEAGGFEVQLLAAPGYRVNVGPGRIRHNRAFARALKAFAATASERPDVIVTDIPTTDAAAAAVELGQRWGVPTVLSIRDLWPDFFADFMPRPLRPLAPLLFRRLDAEAAFACRHCDVLTGVSRSYLEWGARKGGRPVDGLGQHVVPLGYRAGEDHALTADEREHLLRSMGVDTGRTVVAFVGTWGMTTDLDIVAETARLLSARDDIRFVIGGAGRYGEAAADRMRGLANVVLPGWLDARQVQAILDAADIGLLTYRETAPQGLPNKFFAYMSHGAHQVTTLGGEAADLLAAHDLGVPVRCGDAVMMADAVTALVARRREGDRARIRRFFHETFAFDQVYGRFVEIIEEAAVRHGTSAADDVKD